MEHRRGWGTLLLIAVPLLLWLVWAQLNAQTSTLTLERYQNWYAREMPQFLRPLSQFYLKNKRLAGSADVMLPEIPRNSGISSWSIQADTTVLINLNAKIDGKAVKLLLVPVVHSPDSIDYDCLSETSIIYVRNFCYASSVRSMDGVPAQLAENARKLTSFPRVTTSSGESLAPGTSIGSVLAVPSSVEELQHCGYQCVKVQSCEKPRPLACGKTMIAGDSRWYEITAPQRLFRGSDIATRTDADKICEQSMGEGAKALVGTSVTGVIKLDANTEYWVHNDVATHNNCWQPN